MGLYFILVALISFLAGFGAGYYYARRMFFYGALGTPQPDGVDCDIPEVRGTLAPQYADEPDDYRAYIFDSCPATFPDPATLPALTSSEPAPNFRLQGVGIDANHTDPVCVAVWAHYGDFYYLLGTANLDCDNGGSGAGSFELRTRQSGATARQQVADTAPLECTIDVSGFEPAQLNVFNRVWKLVHRENSQRLLWDNGGDGQQRPRVELTTERPFGTPWNLTFRLGEIVISYTKSAEEWQNLAANTFRSVSTAGLVEDAILPASVTVVPA